MIIMIVMTGSVIVIVINNIRVTDTDIVSVVTVIVKVLLILSPLLY